MHSLFVRPLSISTILILVVLLLTGCQDSSTTSTTAGNSPAAADPKDNTAKPVYLDAEEKVANRVEDLISRMTVEEKIAQVTAVWRQKKEMYNDSMGLDTAMARQLMPYGIGHITRPSELAGPPASGRLPADQIKFINEIQRWLVEETRLGIPAIMHEESLHGLAAKNATSWNQPIGLASTWNPELARELYAIAARQTRARGGHLLLTPVVDVCREPRWGRVEETFGEDPHLSAEMGIAAVLGFQGDDDEIGPNEVLATLKHMTGHGQPEGGNNIAPAHIGKRTMHEVFLHPFKRVVQEARVANIMASYNEIDGIPSHANDWMLNDLLRDEWGFDGVVVSDYYGVEELASRHHLAATLEKAAVLSISSGVDIELPDGKAFPFIAKAIEEGRLNMNVLDRAAGRILTQKFRLGLFENPYEKVPEPGIAENTPADAAVALRAAIEGMVMLKNDSLLPLGDLSGKTIALVGPNADRVLLGGYSDEPAYFVTVRQGLEEYLNEKGGKLIFSQGITVTEPGSWYLDDVVMTDEAQERAGIAAAIAAVKDADVVVLALGGNEMTSREAWVEGHLGDRASLDLLGLQNELVNEMAKTGKPLVSLIYGGRPLDIRNVVEQSAAVFQCWYQGQETGHAVARILAGEANPSGKLPISMPRSAGHIPAYYNHKPTARRGYAFDNVNALFPFGYGLSYSNFTYSEPVVNDTIMPLTGTIQVSIDVTNDSEISGEEVVQLYIHDQTATVTRRIKELRNFKKVELNAGETQTVTFTVHPADLEFLDRDMEWVVEPGLFTAMIGSSSRDEDLKKIVFRVR